MRKLAGIGWGFAVVSGLMLGACTDNGDDDPGQPAGGASGKGGSSAGTAGSGSSNAKGGAAGSTSGGSSSGGSSATGGDSGSSGGSQDDDGGSGGSVDEGGAGGGGPITEPCTPASTEGIPYLGTCTYDDYCSEQYDTTFTVEELQQICEEQSGTWSQGPCDASAWDMTCTQEFGAGVYVHYMPANGFCFGGCEQPL